MKPLFAVLIVLLGLLQYRLWFCDSNIPELRQYQQQIDALKQKASQLRARNKVLEMEIVKLKSGLDGVEEYARKDLGMIKQGETFFQVIEDFEPSLEK